jgi:hypothetical protein
MLFQSNATLLYCSASVDYLLQSKAFAYSISEITFSLNSFFLSGNAANPMSPFFILPVKKSIKYSRSEYVIVD